MSEPGLAYRDPITGGRHYTSRSRWLVEDGRIVNSGELPSNKEFPGVTQILKMLDRSDPMVNAAVRLTAENAVDTVDVWSAELAEDWDNGREEVLKKLKKHYRDVWYSKAKRGSEIHEIVEKVFIDGEPLDDVYKRIAGDPLWSGFQVEEVDMICRPLLKFFEKHITEVLATEGTCYAIKEGWAGSFDAMVRLKTGEIAILDWKTGKGPYSSFALQLEAYSHCDRLAVPVEYEGEPGNRKPSRWRLERMPKADIGGVVMLRGDWKADVTWIPFTEMKAECVRALRSLYLWSRLEGNSYISNRTGRLCGARQLWYQRQESFDATGEDLKVLPEPDSDW